MNIKEHFSLNSLNEVLLKDLTPKEFEIIGMVADGLGIQEIAQKLIIAPCTVKTHLSNIRLKLNVDTNNFQVALCLFWNAYKDELLERVAACKR